jgi:hypothetical protein
MPFGMSQKGQNLKCLTGAPYPFRRLATSGLAKEGGAQTGLDCAERERVAPPWHAFGRARCSSDFD